MKIYRKVVLDLAGRIIEEDSFEYSGPVIECKGGSSTTTTGTPQWQSPYLQDVYQMSQGLSRQPITAYPGSTVAGFSPQQQAAQFATTNRALQGSPLLGSAQAQNLMTMGGGYMQSPTIQGDYFKTPTISGQYLNPQTNPWLSKTFEMSAKDVTDKYQQGIFPQIKSAAMGTGAYGGSRQGVAEGIASGKFAEELSDLATKIYGPAYEAERQRQEAAYGMERGFQEGAYGAERGYQQAAMQFAPTLAEADYADISKMAAVGEEQQSMQQALIDDAIKRWEFSQLEPWQRLGMYSNLITGDVGGITTSMRSGK